LEGGLVKGKSWWARLRSFDERGLLIDRLEGDLAITKKGYIFDRRIFRVFLIFMFATLAYLMFTTTNVQVHEFYMVCVGPTPCQNQFYHACDREECKSIENQEVLPAGFELGKKPDPIFEKKISWFVEALLGAFVLTFLANHFLHNKGRSLETIFNLEVEEK
jgi:hypothetical protein